MDNALVSSGRNTPVCICAAGIGPRPHVSVGIGSINHTVAVSVHALSILYQADVHNAIAVTVGGPYAAVEVDGSARRILRLPSRRGEILANDRPGVSINLNQSSLCRNCHPDEVEVSRGVIELDLIGNRMRNID